MTTNRSADTLETAARLSVSTTRLARRLRQQADTGLTPSQLSALTTIERRGPLTLGALAERERVAPPSITRVLAKLEKAGLVERSVDPADRRVWRVAVTAKGVDLLVASRQHKQAWLAERLAELDDDQRARLRAALDVLDVLTIGPAGDTNAPTPAHEPAHGAHGRSRRVRPR